MARQDASTCATTPCLLTGRDLSPIVGKMMQKSVGIFASVIYPSVLNLVQRFDQQRRGFELALSYLSIFINIYLYIEVFIYMCVFSPCPFRRLFWFVWLRLLKTLILMDSWTFQYKTQRPCGLATVRNSAHPVIILDTIHFSHFKRT